MTAALVVLVVFSAACGGTLVWLWMFLRELDLQARLAEAELDNDLNEQAAKSLARLSGHLTEELDLANLTVDVYREQARG